MQLKGQSGIVEIPNLGLEASILSRNSNKNEGLGLLLFRIAGGKKRVKERERVMNNLMSEIICATKQERQRIEEEKNRSRYFIFGKINERNTNIDFSISFENAPERVIRDAQYASEKGNESTFKVGDFFIIGTMIPILKGVEVTIPYSNLKNFDIDISAFKRTMGEGIEYVMDNRDLMNNLLLFLEKRECLQNSIFEALMLTKKVVSIPAVAKNIGISDLNPSQNYAISKALEQKVTFFWGPPGTGKTKTMGALASTLIMNDKRVLLVALSNTALDQLLLATVERLRLNRVNTSIARLGSSMDEKCLGFSRDSFNRNDFLAKRAGLKWSEHVRYSSLVATNFAFLSMPKASNPELFDYVIADEVSMANIPSLLVSTFFSKSGFVAGGDPKQLPPIFPEDAEEPNEWFHASIFEKAGVNNHSDPRVAFLNTQYRMQKQIGKLVSETFYDGILQTGTIELPITQGFHSRVWFLNIQGDVKIQGSLNNMDEQKRYNETHAELVANMVGIGLTSGFKASEIGVIAPYNAQVVTITKAIQKLPKGENEYQSADVKVSTIHSFQGQERRMIIVDFTDNNIMPTRLTAKWELINVALSRAKEQLFLVGNKEYLLNEKFFSIEERTVFEKILMNAILIEY